MRSLPLTASRLLPLGVIAGAFLWCFWEALFFNNNFAFRDGAHFYYPLFEFVQREWGAGRIPLWNPYENSGEPLLANSTSCVFYPGKLLFLLPLSYPWAYKIYILLHALLAAATAYLLARRFGTSRLAATLCAVSYAFSGQILFQYLNIVFLCGAAWLPLAVWLTDAMLVTRQWRYAGWLGGILALMVLGGDPQLAYETGALAALAAVLYWRADHRHATSESGSSPAAVSWLQSRPMLLAMAAAWMAGLSAVQWIPTAELSGLSDRGYFDVPRNLYEVPVWLARDHAPVERVDGTQAHWYDGLIGKPPVPISHLNSIYNFSFPPWRLVEFVWPNIGGRPLPAYRRWLTSVTGEGRFWTPTIYMGLLPLVLAAGAFRLRRADPRIAWLSWMVVLGVFASFGSYGVGWLWAQASDKPPIGPEVGGLYWLLTVLLPGFVQFRFPAKLLTPAALALSVLAAIGWQQLEAGRTTAFRRLLAASSIASVAGLLALAAISPFWNDWFVGKFDLYFGPLDVDGAFWGAALSLLHTLVISGLLLLCLRTASEPSARSDDAASELPKRVIPWRLQAAVALTAIEICLANSWLVVTAPASLWTRPSRGAQLLREAEREGGASAPAENWPRLLRIEFVSPEFKDTPSHTRPADGVEWDRDTLKPKYALAEGLSQTRVYGTIQLFDYHLFLAPLVFTDPPRLVQPRRAYDALGVEYFLLPKTSVYNGGSLWIEALQHRWQDRPANAAGPPPEKPEGARLPPAVDDTARWLGPRNDQIDILANDSAFPRAWIVHDVFVTARIETSDRHKLMPMLVTMIAPKQHVIDMRQAAWVESDELDQLTPEGRLQTPAVDPSAESCRITNYEPQRVEIVARLSAPGLVVLSDMYYPGWQLSVTSGGQTRDLPLLRTNRVMRGALLPAGEFKLVYEYRPTSFYLGAAVSVAACLAAIISLVAIAVGNRRAMLR
jgi:hypothetical protein